ncbi:hypothetical protein GGS23DRAFT_463739 [Durotheca rogersii]|uniref:uncharacterized protein n=1 Tax=Durotheca rogersii TaxID=419775 RepID=UPI00221E9B8C|nr:uncharacterized protein GGS23DRAFT_463739 [Durotheca rogersii]KAI5864792.1 hypothetical protein GGS23DRAFT_463739 [Durotheca rogersii]
MSTCCVLLLIFFSFSLLPGPIWPCNHPAKVAPYPTYQMVCVWIIIQHSTDSVPYLRKANPPPLAFLSSSRRPRPRVPRFQEKTSSPLSTFLSFSLRIPRDLPLVLISLGHPTDLFLPLYFFVRLRPDPNTCSAVHWI